MTKKKIYRHVKHVVQNCFRKCVLMLQRNFRLSNVGIPETTKKRRTAMHVPDGEPNIEHFSMQLKNCFTIVSWAVAVGAKEGLMALGAVWDVAASTWDVIVYM